MVERERAASSVAGPLLTDWRCRSFRRSLCTLPLPYLCTLPLPSAPPSPHLIDRLLHGVAVGLGAPRGAPQAVLGQPLILLRARTHAGGKHMAIYGIQLKLAKHTRYANKVAITGQAVGV